MTKDGGRVEGGWGAPGGLAKGELDPGIPPPCVCLKGGGAGGGVTRSAPDGGLV